MADPLESALRNCNAALQNSSMQVLFGRSSGTLGDEAERQQKPDFWHRRRQFLRELPKSRARPDRIFRGNIQRSRMISKTQAELLRKQRELEDEKSVMDLQIETRVQEALSHIRHKAKQEAEDAMKLKVLEKEEQIASMQRQLEELDLLFQYLTGPRFRHRIEAIVEKFSIMQTDLERERKTMMRLRARRKG